jgi:hypothetical protein
MLNPNLTLIILTFALTGFLAGGTTGAAIGALAACVIGLFATFVDVLRHQ